MKITRIEAFQVRWSPATRPAQRSAFVRVDTDDGITGWGEASPMQGGRASVGMIRHDIAPRLIGHDPLDHAVLLDTALHELVKLGPEGALTGALAALDIALWDIKGKAAGLPIYKLLGGAWRTALPFYASIGGNGDRAIDDVLRIVETRLEDKPAAVKIRFDNNRTRLDANIPGDIAKARAVRKLVGDGFPLAFDANNGYTTGGAIRVGRALEDLGYWWFEEPVQHYHPKAMGELSRALDITVSAGEQTYTIAGIGRSDRCRGAHGAARHRENGRHHGADALRRAVPRAWRGIGAAPDPADHRPHGQSAVLRHAIARDEAVRVERSVIPHACGIRQSAAAGGRAVSFAGRTWAGIAGA